MQQETNQGTFIKRIWVKYGLLGGVISSLIILGLYIISTELLFNRAISVVTIFVLILFGFLAALERKKQQGSYLTYGDSMATSMGALMFGVIIMSVVNYLLFFVIDPHILDIMVAKMVEGTEEALLKANKPQADIDKVVSQLQTNGHKYILLNTLIAPVIIGLFGLIVYLITSAIIKKEPKD
jgi:hypothetical protein